jgi:hypothetical protein
LQRHLRHRPAFVLGRGGGGGEGEGDEEKKENGGEGAHDRPVAKLAGE